MITEQIEKDQLRVWGGGGFRVFWGKEESAGVETGMGDTGGHRRSGVGGSGAHPSIEPITPHCSLIPEQMSPSGRA